MFIRSTNNTQASSIILLESSKDMPHPSILVNFTEFQYKINNFVCKDFDEDELLGKSCFFRTTLFLLIPYFTHTTNRYNHCNIIRWTR